MAYGNDSAELVVASNGSIYVAPEGTALPSEYDDSLNAAFVDLGYASEDGVTLSVTPDIAEFSAWQSRSPVRRELNMQNLSVSFSLEQWASEQVEFAFGGGEVTEVTSGSYRYDFPNEDEALDERALVVDWQDGTKEFRLVVPRGNVTESVETNLVRANLAVLPITFAALESDGSDGIAYLLSNDSAFGTGS